MAVLKKLDAQCARINFRFHQRTERREGVKRFAARPLAFGILDRAVADVLRGGVAENVARRLRGRDVADFASDDDGQFGFVIRAMLAKRDFNLPAVGNQ